MIRLCLSGMLLANIVGMAAVHAGLEAVRTGLQRLQFAEPSPLSEPDVLLTRLDANSPQIGFSLETAPYELRQTSFEVFVPDGYRPGVPYGLFVWMGVTPVPTTWQDVFSRYKLICVSAYPENPAPPYSRSRMPLDAVYNMKKLYSIDEDRVYAAGFSAGAGVAASLTRGFPDVFKGGCFFNGGMFYGVARMDDGQYKATIDEYPPKWKGKAETIRREERLVLMRGERDTVYPPRIDRPQYDALLLDGFERVEFLVVPGLGHSLPDAAWFARGIDLLDHTQPKMPPVTSPTKDTKPLPGQISQAERLLATAQMRINGVKSLAKKKRITWAQAAEEYPRTVVSARVYLQQVMDEYPTTPAAAKARKKLEEMEKKTPTL